MKVMEAGNSQRPFAHPNLAKRLLPFGVGTVIGLAIPFVVPGVHIDLSYRYLVPAALVAVATFGSAYLLRSRNLPEWCDILPVFGYVLVLAALRGSIHGLDLPYLPLLTLALWWLALYHRPSQYIAGSSMAAAAMLVSLVWAKESTAVWIDGLERIGLAIAFGFVVLYFVARLQEQHDELAHMSITDPVTGAANIRTWEITMRTQMRWSRRNREPFTVAIIHIGDLVEINNRHGFAAGDSLLAACTAAWIPELRESDTLFRLYGSDFTVVLPSADTTVAKVLLDRLRQVSPDLTCSIGIATWNRSEKMTQLLHRARTASEEAMELGGDCVVVDSPSLDIVMDDDDAHLTVGDGTI